MQRIPQLGGRDRHSFGVDYPFVATPSDGTISLVMIAGRRSKTVAFFATLALLLGTGAAFGQSGPQLIMREVFPIERPADRPDETLREPSTVSAARKRPPGPPMKRRLFAD